LDEERYRQRILVMTTGCILLAVGVISVLTPMFVNLRPEGGSAANLIFLIMGGGALVSMIVLRYTKRRLIALNIMLTIFMVAFTVPSFMFGGIESPTYPLMVIAPIMAGIVGNLRSAVIWCAIVFAVWACFLTANILGVEVAQIIKPQNKAIGMTLANAAMTTTILAILLTYVEMNRILRNHLQRTNSELEHLSSHDQLTDLPNRRFYDERLSLALQRAAQMDGMTALLVLDLNDFKKINDSYGHGAGDKVLITVAKRMRDTLRETDMVARLGGDEFVAVLEDVRSTQQVTKIANKLSQALEQPVSVRQHQLNFSVSIGIAVFPLDGRQKPELEEQADKAMYQAKKRGIPVALSSLEPETVLRPVKIHNADG